MFQNELRRVFPGEWSFMTDLVGNYFNDCCGLSLSTRKTEEILNMGVVFGKKIFTAGFTDYTEIGCGFAIPSLTVSRLGGKSVHAFDVDRVVTEYAKILRNRCKAPVEIECQDFTFFKKNIKNRGILIAEKPRTRSTCSDLESEVIDFVLEKQMSLAIVPCVKGKGVAALSGYAENCVQIVKKMSISGYSVDSQQICETLPLQWIIARKV